MREDIMTILRSNMLLVAVVGAYMVAANGACSESTTQDAIDTQQSPIVQVEGPTTPLATQNDIPESYSKTELQSNDASIVVETPELPGQTAEAIVETTQPTVQAQDANVIPQNAYSTAPNIKAKAKPQIRRGGGAITQVVTCEQALARCLGLRIPVIDLSNARDFGANGISAIEKFLTTLSETNTYGTGAQNIYVNVSGTRLTPESMVRIVTALTNSGRRAILNISNNPQVNDNAVAQATQLLSSVVILNVSGTGITDAGVATLIDGVKSGNLPQLRAVSLDRTKATPGQIEALGATINEFTQRVSQQTQSTQPDDTQPLSATNEAQATTKENTRSEMKRTTNIRSTGRGDTARSALLRRKPIAASDAATLGESTLPITEQNVETITDAPANTLPEEIANTAIAAADQALRDDVPTLSNTVGDDPALPQL
ncbi:MAG: hypothetical protein LBJ42_02055 [Holosporales bacterium]|jgi:hypothetical protein|nr:hypothetical protein [Holosporales bacterium]